MPKPKYEPIYLSIKKDIEEGVYSFGDQLPSENTYADRFDCTRNTVRRALNMLTNQGYIQPQHGKGVSVIYRKEDDRSIFTVGGIESFAETTQRNQKNVTTKVMKFQKVICDERISEMTGFDEGNELYYIERIRIIDGKAIIFDTNIYLASETPGLNEDIAVSSIYRYLENELKMTITTSKRRITAEKATEKDKEYLDLDEDIVLVVSGQVFNSKGIMFEYTQSRHRADSVCFVETASRVR